ncbi:MAG: tetratricopeptide repeat protein, partial [Pseudomonadota bacterium]
VQNWLRENGLSLIMGVALALAAIFGWRQYQNYQVSQANLASDYYTLVQTELQEDRLLEAIAQYDTMREAVPEHSYTSLAGMLIAAQQVENQELAPAIEVYRGLLANQELASLEPIVRLRLAQLLTATEQTEEAINLLAGDAPFGHEALWLETRGDLALDQGQLEQAEAFYQQALDQLQGQGGNVRLLETKLDSVRTTVVDAS